MRRRPQATLFLAILAVSLPAVSCGPDFPEAVFVKSFGPDAPYSAFVAGRLGVPRATYRVRHFAIAYDLLTGRSLNAAEQRAAEDANSVLLNDSARKSDNAAPGYDAWLKARGAFGLIDGAPPPTAIVVTRSVPGMSYQDFPNCLDDAFATAARTLGSRASAHGAASSEVKEWVRGQDRVFANCGDLPGSVTGGTYHPETPPPVSIPAPLQNAPLWLTQDRAYQIAAAHFYAVDYDAARAAFQAIAGDHASPWSSVSAYLAARSMIRQATVTEGADLGTQTTTPEQREAAVKQQLAALGRAAASLRALRADPRMSSLQPSIDGLLDWLALRLDPQAQRLVLAGRLHGVNDNRFGQDLIDLTFASLHAGVSAGGVGGAAKPISSAVPGTVAANTRADVAMLAWLDVMATANESAAVSSWRATHSTAWLLAALTFASPGDPAVAELTRAADAVSAREPAWVALTYHRLRLMPRSAAMRSALAAVLPSVTTSQGASTKNLFTGLDAASAPDLETWLHAAGQVPASVSFDGEENDLQPAADMKGPAAGDAAKPVDQACGPSLPEYQTRLFTPPAAEALNTRMPLSVLAAAAEGRGLPPHLRFAVAQSAWTRAVLLDRPEEAKRMTAILVGCRDAWKPVLAAYDQAASPDARHVAGLLALMRFASTEPNVRVGEPRSEGFATYSSLRDNWWDRTVSPALNTSEQNFTQPRATGQDVSSTDTTSDAEGAKSGLPPDSLAFLTEQDRAAARTEIARLRQVPSASDYFAGEALTWWRNHPTDPADADLLGQAMRVARNAPRTEHTAPNQHALFDALHSAFPNSSWAKRYTTWE